jgi:hypothetical protein
LEVTYTLIVVFGATEDSGSELLDHAVDYAKGIAL